MQHPPSPSDILAILYRVMDDVNAQQAPESRLVAAPDTVIVGESGRLDSLGLVTLLVGVEDAVRDSYRRSVTLIDERLMLDAAGPLTTAGRLAAYVAEQLAR